MAIRPPSPVPVPNKSLFSGLSSHLWGGSAVPRPRCCPPQDISRDRPRQGHHRAARARRTLPVSAVWRAPGLATHHRPEVVVGVGCGARGVRGPGLHVGAVVRDSRVGLGVSPAWVAGQDVVRPPGPCGGGRPAPRVWVALVRLHRRGLQGGHLVLLQTRGGGGGVGRAPAAAGPPRSPTPPLWPCPALPSRPSQRTPSPVLLAGSAELGC